MFAGVVSYDAGTDNNFGTSDDLQYTGTRRAEDLLLSNVHSFDIDVWDEDLGRYVDIGHNIPGGDFYQDTNTSGAGPGARTGPGPCW